MAKVQASHPAPKGKKRRVAHVRITHGNNGYAVHHEFEREAPKPHSMNSISPMEPDPKPNYFAGKNAKKDMMNHLSGLADQMGPEQEEEPAA